MWFIFLLFSIFFFVLKKIMNLGQVNLERKVDFTDFVKRYISCFNELKCCCYLINVVSFFFILCTRYFLDNFVIKITHVDCHMRLFPHSTCFSCFCFENFIDKRLLFLGLLMENVFFLFMYLWLVINLS